MDWILDSTMDMKWILRQGFWQGAAKNGKLCGIMKVNCVAKSTNCAANCAAVNC